MFVFSLSITEQHKKIKLKKLKVFFLNEVFHFNSPRGKGQWIVMMNVFAALKLYRRWATEVK